MFGSRYRSARVWAALALVALFTVWSVPSFARHPSAESRWRNPYCPDGVCTTKDPYNYYPTRWQRWPGAAKEERQAQEEVERRAIVKPKESVSTPTTPTDTETTPTDRRSAAPGDEESPFNRFLDPNPTPQAGEEPSTTDQPKIDQIFPMDEEAPMREPLSIPEDTTTPSEPGLVPIPTPGPTLEQDQDDQSNPFLPNDEDADKNKDGASFSPRQTIYHLSTSGGSQSARPPRRLPDTARASKPLAPRVDSRRVAAVTSSRSTELARHRASAIASEADGCNPLRRDLEETQTFERAPAPGRQQFQRSGPSRMLADPSTSNPLRLASAAETQQSNKEACYEDNSPSSTVNPLRSR